MFRFRLVKVLRFWSNALFCHLFWTFSETFVIENEVSEGKHTSRKATRQRKKRLSWLDCVSFDGSEYGENILLFGKWYFVVFFSCRVMMCSHTPTTQQQQRNWYRPLDSQQKSDKNVLCFKVPGYNCFFSLLFRQHTHTSRRMMGENTITLISAHLLYTHTQR